MPLGQGIPLNYLVGVAGAQQGTAAIRGLTTQMAASRSAFGQPLDVGGWMKPIGGIRNALSGIGRMAAGVFGGMGLTFGAGGIMKLLRESGTFREDLVSFQVALRLTNEQTDELGRAMENAAVRTGRNRVELLAAARAGTDYGLSVKEVMENMEDLDALARVMKVSPDLLMKGMGGLRKLAGDEVSSQQLRSMAFAGSQASGMPEDVFLEMVGKLAPQLSGIKGLEGESGVGFLMSQIAALGETFATEPRKFKSGLQSMIDAIRDPKNAETLKRLGVRTDNVANAQHDLLTAVIGHRKGVEKLEPGLLDFLNRVVQTEGALGRLESSQDTFAGNMDQQSAALQAQLDKVKNEPTWDKLMERFKKPLLEAADAVFSAFMTWAPKIGAALSSFVTALSSAGESMGAALARVLGLDVESQVQAAQAQGMSDADKLAAAGFYTARTPEERAAARRRAGPGVGEGVGSETWFDRARAFDTAEHGPETGWRGRWSGRGDGSAGGWQDRWGSSEAQSLADRAAEFQRQSFQSQVNVYVEQQIDGPARVRAEGGNRDTMVNVNGAPAQ